MSEGCGNCSENKQCKDHIWVEKQMKALEDLPLTVSKLTGIVSVIAGLFTLLVALAFNSHFEQIRQAHTIDQKFDTLGQQITEMSDQSKTSERRLSDRLLLIEAQEGETK